ncbi:TonB-dependent receptor [Flavobacterium sp.]
MKTLYALLFILSCGITFAQTEISGTVVDQKNRPLAGANLFIDGTYDGATTDENGKFSFTTTEIGSKKLVITMITYEDFSQVIDVAICKNKTFVLRESVNTLDTVIITAGTFDSGEKARVSVLKPLDIVTTAGSNGNIVAALQTLPGTQTVGEDGRLFVRGGEADETQTFVDGIRVAQPYGATTGNLPTRGRFSPFLFSGISFSTGGYSAEYGEALSSVLLLNTVDEATEEKTDVSLMTVGLGLANTQKWGNNSLTFNTAYVDLAPYQKLIPQNVSWNKPFRSLSGEAVYRHSFSNGIFKLYAAFDASEFDINQESINEPILSRVKLSNNNFYLNASYKANLGNQWKLFTGMAYGYSQNDISIYNGKLFNVENSNHFKVKVNKALTERIKITFGGDYFITKFDEYFKQAVDLSRYDYGYDANIAAAYVETDIFFSRKLGLKVGARVSNNEYLKETILTPRLSMGYKVSPAGQLSLAYGMFTQAPRQEYLKFANYLSSEKANHYILNYLYYKEGKTFRAEVYYKKYGALVKYDDAAPNFSTNFNNNGDGYAKGIDILWRDNKSVKNLEYWISYSYIDTQRDYKNYPTEATPSFVANQSLAIVGKWWIDKWKSQLSVTNSFSTGRPYNNPNESTYLGSKTKGYNNLSLSWAYLISQQKILYFSASNVLATQNVYGYEYANTANTNGLYDRRAIRPTADQFFFIGFFWTISDNKSDNQLKNL